MKALTEFSVIAFIIVSGFIFLQVANATPYAWNQSPIQVSWTVIPVDNSMTISDINRDGVGDLIYTRNAITMTKKFGSTGVASFIINAGPTARDIVYVKEDRVLQWWRNGAACSINVVASQWSLLTGTNFTTSKVSTTNTGTFTAATGLINKNNNTAFICRQSDGVPILAGLAVKDNPNVNGTFTTTGSAGGPYHIQIIGSGKRIYTYENTLYSNNTDTSTQYVAKTTTNILTNVPAMTIPSNVYVDNNIKLFSSALDYPERTIMTTTLLSSRLDMPANNTMSIITTLPPRILHTAFTTPPVYLQLDDGTTTYFAAIIGTNLYYTDYNSLLSQIESNRAFQNYRIDPTGTFITTPISTAMPTQALTVLFANGTSIAYTSPAQLVLPSGYYLQVPTLTRYYYPDFSNTLVAMPIGSITGSFSILTAIANNAPQNSAVKITNSSLYNNTLSYVDAVTFLQADRSVSVSLRNNACHEFFISDSSQKTPNWVSQGTLCNSGTMPKTIAYTLNLPLTFWTLVWGAAHNYTTTNNNLQTDVRHDTTPYTYNVVVKHSNGTVAINQTFTTSNEPDVRNFNVSSVAKPASLYIKSDSAQGSQIYSAYLGSPVTLASVASFFHTYFSYGGFDLISFIPIVFAAMFTRNTVGLGAVLTVVCIATLSWLSVVPIPDVYITIMAIVSIIGMIGYKIYAS